MEFLKQVLEADEHKLDAFEAAVLKSNCDNNGKDGKVMELQFHLFFKI